MDYDEVSWPTIETLVRTLAEKIQNTSIQFNSISTVSRGGLIPARLLADRLNIKEIKVDQDKIPSDSLFVDDIYDTGNTFQKILPKCEDPENLVFATLFARKGKSYPKQLMYSTQTRGDEYIVYPWDRYEHLRKPN